MTALDYDPEPVGEAVPSDHPVPDEAAWSGDETPRDETDLPWSSVETFYRQIQSGLLVRLFYLLSSRHDAEDVMHDAFIQAARKWHTLRNKSASSATAWLYRIAVNLALNKLRQRKRRGEVALGELTNYQSVHQFVSALLSPEQAYEVSTALDALNSLSQRQREIYLLRHYFGFDIEDIADHLGRGPSTVRVHLHRAQETVRRKFGDGSGGRSQ